MDDFSDLNDYCIQVSQDDIIQTNFCELYVTESEIQDISELKNNLKRKYSIAYYQLQSNEMISSDVAGGSLLESLVLEFKPSTMILMSDHATVNVSKFTMKMGTYFSNLFLTNEPNLTVDRNGFQDALIFISMSNLSQREQLLKQVSFCIYALESGMYVNKLVINYIIDQIASSFNSRQSMWFVQGSIADLDPLVDISLDSNFYLFEVKNDLVLIQEVFRKASYLPLS